MLLHGSKLMKTDTLGFHSIAFNTPFTLHILDLLVVSIMLFIGSCQTGTDLVSLCRVSRERKVLSIPLSSNLQAVP